MCRQSQKIKKLKKVLTFVIACNIISIVQAVLNKTKYARVAQWWSIALPRRGSRVRIPSRAFLKGSGFPVSASLNFRIESIRYARVAQWWSIALPRRGSRVRIPSRAFFVPIFKKKAGCHPAKIVLHLWLYRWIACIDN